jgi:thioredoxin-like negative regulator of GroEL
MAFFELTNDDLEQFLTVSPKTLVMFGTDWCSECVSLKPEFETISKTNVEIPFVYVNADEQPNSRNLVEFKNIPTIVAFDKTKNLGQKYGNKVDVITSVLENLK